MTERSFCVPRFLNRNTFEQSFFRFCSINYLLTNVQKLLFKILLMQKGNLLKIIYKLTVKLLHNFLNTCSNVPYFTK